MPYISHTENERQEMLSTIGVQTFNELIKNIPTELLLKKDINLPAPLSEFEVIQLLNQLAKKNINSDETVSFLGGGAYDHFIPVAIDHLILRSEFYTSYTPYQPEVSQGTLQAIYEYQTAICEITGMDVANASMYDGGSALAEGALMAINETQREQIIVSQGVHPHYRQIIKTYCHGQGIEIIEIPLGNGITDLEILKSRISDQTAGVLIQHPNFLGYLEDVDEIAPMIHQHGGLFVTSNDPISLGVLNPPGAYDVDIMTGEGQVLGNSLNFGGPYLGIFAVKSQYVRRMPGRLVGATVDSTGKRGFVLTLQTREQHIRRAKATSNICTNQALNALIGTIYLTLMGKTGFQKVAELCLQKSHYLAEAIQTIDGPRLKYKSPFFKEFVFESPLDSQELLQKLGVKKIIGGTNLANFDYNLPNSILVATTEKRTRTELDYYISVLKEIFR
ncbi:aminomethyl-transferring glycine dehydrogenase subunit GcvPA [candidate division KSB1 bacterium]|nr:aminomethyl-transferring glycine dehydrogenase subunit GcvPA [candidate division KSB1 bacterium]